MADNRFIVAAKQLVTMDGEDTVMENGYVAVAGGKIAKMSEYQDDMPADWPVVDAGDFLVLPGLIDAHLHAGLAMPLALGRIAALGGYRPANWPSMAMNTPFCCGGDINAVIPDIDTLPVTPDDVYQSAKLAMLDSLCSGVTAVIEGGSPHPEACEQAAADVGIRYISAYPAGDMVGAEAGGLKRVRDADTVAGHCKDYIAAKPGGRIVRAIAPIVAHGCSDDLLDLIAAVSQQADASVITHVATLKNETAATRAVWNEGPFRRLANAGLLNERLVAIHAGYPEEEDWDSLAAAGLSIVHCPQASTLIPTGYFGAGAIPRYHDAGINLAIGTDVSRNSPLLHQLADAASFHKDRTLEAATMDAPIVMRAATRGGAKAARLKTGSLEIGCAADMIFVDLSGPHYALSENFVRSFIETGRLSDIKRVMVGGDLVMPDREAIEQACAAQARIVNERLKSKLPAAN